MSPEDDLREMKRLLAAQKLAYAMATDFNMDELNRAEEAFWLLEEKIGRARYSAAFSAAINPNLREAQ